MTNGFERTHALTSYRYRVETENSAVGLKRNTKKRKQPCSIISETADEVLKGTTIGLVALYLNYIQELYSIHNKVQ